MTPTAEFNIWVDPVAAKLVIASGIPMTMVGLDVTLKAALNREDEQEIRSFGNKGAVLAAGLFYKFYLIQKILCLLMQLVALVAEQGRILARVADLVDEIG